MPITKVSRKILNRVEEQLLNQNAKGLAEYGVTIDDANDEEYDWNFEALGEVLDALQYQVKENMRLRKENKELLLNEQRLILQLKKGERNQ